MRAKVTESIGLVMRDSDADIATYVPGLGVSDIYYDYCKAAGKQPVMSFHEEVAYTIAHDAALAGKRAFTVLKAHGFIKAANSVSDSLYSGTTAGFVVIIVDDVKGIQSDYILDTMAFIKGAGIPHKAAIVENVYQDVVEGFEISERLCLPYALVIDASDVSRSLVVPEQRRTGVCESIYKRDIAQHVIRPPFCKYQHGVLRCKNLGGDLEGISRPPIMPIPQSLPERWRPFAERYARLFEAFRAVRGPIVAGDTGMLPNSRKTVSLPGSAVQLKP
jgi:TPP-dependent indolepyruvate ferredoxin oxidoreductase alpha subunit